MRPLNNFGWFVCGGLATGLLVSIWHHDIGGIGICIVAGILMLGKGPNE